MLLSGVVQAFFAGLSAFIIRRLGVIHGLLTAFTSGIIGSAGFLVINLLSGGILDLLLVFRVLSSMLGWGFLFSIPAGWLASNMGNLILRKPEAAALQPSTLARE
jgi:hypothetical protein